MRVAEMCNKYLADEFQGRGQSSVVEFQQPDILQKTLAHLLNVQQPCPVEDLETLMNESELVLKYCVRTGMRVLLARVSCGYCTL